MRSEGKIPIFPLNVVLMPYGLLPLHIFEDRYKQMINECLSNDGVFGVVYLEEKHLHKTGCSARIEKVLKQYEDGRMDIIVRGQQRFKIIDISEEKPYLQSGIEYFGDEDTPETQEMAELARNGIDLLKKLEKITEVSEGLDRVKKLDLNVISYLMAGSQGLSLAEKQELLEIRYTDERLVRVVELLKSAVDRAQLLRRIRTIRHDTLMIHGFSRN